MRLLNSLHPDWCTLTKRAFKKRIGKFLFTELGFEGAHVDAYSLITKLNMVTTIVSYNKCFVLFLYSFNYLNDTVMNM